MQSTQLIILSKIREPDLDSYFKSKQSKRYNNLKKILANTILVHDDYAAA